MVDIFSFEQIIGYLAFALTMLAFWQKQDKKLLLTNSLAAALWTVQYLMLSAWAGAAAEAIVVIRSFLSAYLKDIRHKHIAAGIFITGFVVVGYFTYHQLYDLLSIASCLIATVCMVYLKDFPLRYGMIIGTFFWGAYNFMAGTIGGVFAGLVLLVIQITTLIRMYRDPDYAKMKEAVL